MPVLGRVTAPIVTFACTEETGFAAALARLNRIAPAGTRADTREAWRNAPALLLVLAGAGLGLAVLSLLPEPAGLQAQVAAELGRSGVSNPVTAVLLNFRGNAHLNQPAYSFGLRQQLYTLLNGRSDQCKCADPGHLKNTHSSAMCAAGTCVEACCRAARAALGHSAQRRGSF